ncbi:MAG TPA: succinylglutamate desuccinylase/aspartoacylase family protein [Thermoanaerobaculia bacterium]|nr:succinylglutamate desuccinylase/aspartoacylase family protein [Thermoanaerobaculia bacterium]
MARPSRLIGRVQGGRPGPTLVAIGGIHGNEPSGVVALQRVVAELAPRAAEVAGEVIALKGNLAALAAGRRYMARDLNRLWLAERIEEIVARAARGLDARPEDHEQAELYRELLAAFEGARGRTYVLDLHSTSGAGAPFVVLCDTLPNRAFARRLPVPVVVGLEEQLEGTLLSFLSDLGHITIAFESGQHDAPTSVENAEAAVWIALETAGLIDGKKLGAPGRVLATLKASGAGLPRVAEVRYRHAIKPEDRFHMDPGYTNFKPVEKGQPLARDQRGAVRSPETGRILMPLYQPLGDDGFFLVRGFNPFWLKLSAVLRRLQADSIVHWLPGVTRHPERQATYRVNRKIARWYALEIFHLLGFRRTSPETGQDAKFLLVARRPHDVEVDHQASWVTRRR